jgi:hypothetical protein
MHRPRREASDLRTRHEKEEQLDSRNPNQRGHLAGNSSIASGTLSVTIDTKAPAAPSKLDMVAASDSGLSNSDNVTNVVAPTLNGRAEAGSEVRLSDGVTQIGAAITAADGTWSIVSLPLSQGAHTVFATSTDTAGNTSVASAKLPVTIDTTAPNAPATTNVTVNANGSAKLAGMAEVGSTVSVFDLSKQLGVAAVDGRGNWTFIKGKFALNALHAFTAAATDKAGNVSGISGSAQLGSSSADTLNSTSGNDLMIGGGAGADTFAFLTDFGIDVIKDFATAGGSHDIINFHAIATLSSFAAVLSHATQGGAGLVISEDVNNTLKLNNVTRSQLTLSDFTFV